VNINLRWMAIIAGLLLLLAGFSVVNFLLNFDQLQRLAEESKATSALRAPPSGSGSDNEDVVSGSEATSNSVAPAYVPAWLVPLNGYRAMVGLAPVTADTQLSRGDTLHSRYLLLNYGAQLAALSLGAEAHIEDPAKPGFTLDGAAAAQASDVDWSWDPHRRPEPWWAIGNWIQVPFHRMQIINPYLRRVGYGTDCGGAICFAALNTGTAVDQSSPTPQVWPAPLAFPPDGSVVHVSEFSAEWPNPLASCPGYVSPAGLPITFELGHLLVPLLTDYSIKQVETNEPVEACAFNTNTYVNSDRAAQTAARAILKDFGAIVIVPRRPLSPGRYAVSVVSGRRYFWSFSVIARNRE
jgi:hypothetical protein